MKMLSEKRIQWQGIGVKSIDFHSRYDNCTQTAYTDDCPTVYCGCVVKSC